MTEVEAATSPGAVKMPRGFLNPYFQLGLGAVLVTASEILLKIGATAVPSEGWLTEVGIAALASWWTWAGIVTYLLSFASWLLVLRYVPLGIALVCVLLAVA